MGGWGGWQRPKLASNWARQDQVVAASPIYRAIRVMVGLIKEYFLFALFLCTC